MKSTLRKHRLRVCGKVSSSIFIANHWLRENYSCRVFLTTIIKAFFSLFSSSLLVCVSPPSHYMWRRRFPRKKKRKKHSRQSAEPNFYSSATSSRWFAKETEKIGNEKRLFIYASVFRQPITPSRDVKCSSLFRRKRTRLWPYKAAKRWATT